VAFSPGFVEGGEKVRSRETAETGLEALIDPNGSVFVEERDEVRSRDDSMGRGDTMGWEPGLEPLVTASGEVWPMFLAES
jgi:hypothetical protein